MYCSKCGAEIPENARFCVKCGYGELAGYKKPKPKKPKVGRWLLGILAVLVLLGLLFPSNDDTETADTETEPEALPFLDDFTMYGYTTEQIEDMRTLLVNVGITEITDLEIGNVSSGMQTITGILFKDTSFGGGMKEVQVRFNIENGVIYLVSIYCPSYITENQVPYLSGLTDRRADLYYDVEGGYLKKIDWDSKAVVDY